MNTFDLSKKINNGLILKQCFIAVLQIDLAPKIVKYPGALILNLGDSNSPGSYWVAIYLTTEECEYFNSCGRKLYKKIIKYISHNSKTFVNNIKCVQDLWSISCGQMCLYYMTWRCRDIPFKKIVFLWLAKTLSLVLLTPFTVKHNRATCSIIKWL